MGVFRDLTIALLCGGLTAGAAADSLNATGARWHNQSAAECDPCDDAAGAQFIASEQFDSELAAVRRAADRYNPVSIREDREFMGVIFQSERRYGFSVTAGKAGADAVTIAITLPQGAELVAFWHTHGAPHWSRRYFSAVDTQLARDWGVRFYLATADGLLRVFSPEDPVMTPYQARRRGLGSGGGFGVGRLVYDPVSNEMISVQT